MDNLLNKTILIVDDTPENIDVLNGLLSDFKRKIAINGEKALKIAFSDNPPDLILLDIMMPGMDGYEVSRRIRENEQTKDIPIIFLSAKSDHEAIITGFEAGGQDYVTKPFNHHELLQRVNTHLKLRDQQEQLKSMNQVLDKKVKERTLELEESNTKLMDALEQLQGLDQAKSNFLRIVSHEIRTPLNGIMGSAYFLEDIIDDPELSEFIEMLKVSATRLERLSGMALEITDMETKASLDNAESINISAIAQEAISDWDNSENLPVTTDFKESNFVGEENRVKQAILELLDNARKFATEDKQIHINTGSDEKYTWVSVANSTGFIDENNLEEMKKPFGLSGEHSDRNTGLGLAYVNAVMAIHNGKLDILYEDGKIIVRLNFIKS